MLNKPVDDIIMENGKVVGVKSEGEVSLPHGAVMMVWVEFLRGSLPSDLGSAGFAASQFSGPRAGHWDYRSLRSHSCWREGSLRARVLCQSLVQGVSLIAVSQQRGSPSPAYGAYLSEMQDKAVRYRRGSSDSSEEHPACQSCQP